MIEPRIQIDGMRIEPWEPGADAPLVEILEDGTVRLRAMILTPMWPVNPHEEVLVGLDHCHLTGWGSGISDGG